MKRKQFGKGGGVTRQTVVYKTQHIKLKHKQHEPHHNFDINLQKTRHFIQFRNTKVHWFSFKREIFVNSMQI